MRSAWMRRPHGPRPAGSGHVSGVKLRPRPTIAASGRSLAATRPNLAATRSLRLIVASPPPVKHDVVAGFCVFRPRIVR